MGYFASHLSALYRTSSISRLFSALSALVFPRFTFYNLPISSNYAAMIEDDEVDEKNRYQLPAQEVALVSDLEIQVIAWDYLVGITTS